MWIFTNHGMVSVVENTEARNTLLVRSRDRDTLEHFLWTKSYRPPIIETPDRDYAYRVVVSPKVLKKRMNREIDRIDYPNFKASIAKKLSAYAKGCADVWAAMLRVYENGRYGVTKSQGPTWEELNGLDLSASEPTETSWRNDPDQDIYGFADTDSKPCLSVAEIEVGDTVFGSLNGTKGTVLDRDGDQLLVKWESNAEDSWTLRQDVCTVNTYVDRVQTDERDSELDDEEAFQKFVDNL